MQRRDVLTGLAAGLAAAQVSGPALAQPAGRYIGDLQVAMEDPGRLMRLIRDYAYVDSGGRRWTVPAGALVDGASIPQAFWSIIGGPFEGRYRNASVIHDYYCDVRTQPWQDVHRMFHEAMLTSQVEPRRAKVMFLAVYYGGPRWSEVVIRNMRIAQAGGVSQSKGPDAERVAAMGELARMPTGLGIDLALPQRVGVAPAGTAADYTIIAVEQPRVDVLTFRQMQKLTEDGDLSLDQIEALVEGARLGGQTG